MAKLRVGFVGAGGIARGAHLPAYQALSNECEVVAAADVAPRESSSCAAAQRTAEANLIASEAILQNLSNEATLAVQTALIELERTAESIKACEEALTAATARLRAAEVKYSEGLGILIEVTSARQDLTSAEADLVRARFDYQTAVIALQREMGTLPIPDEDAEVRP